jgi:hypothetical protein
MYPKSTKLEVNIYENKSLHYEHIYFVIKLYENKPGHYEHICIGECPSNSPFLKNNGAEAPKVPRPVVFKE